MCAIGISNKLEIWAWDVNMFAIGMPSKLKLGTWDVNMCHRDVKQIRARDLGCQYVRYMDVK